MSVEYLGKVNNIVTVEKLKELTGNTPANIVSGDINWLKFNDNGKELLVADRCICNYISWNNLNSSESVFGKVIVINNIRYKCRLLTGHNGDPNVADNSEWKRLIVDLVPNVTDSNWSNYYNICQETSYNSSNLCSMRGYTIVSGTYLNDKNTGNNIYGWRPVLEKTYSLSISDINPDLGHMSSFNEFKYSATNNYGTNLNLTEKVDGKVIRTLNNQASGTEFTFNVGNFDSLPYGNHTIEIIAYDPNYDGNVAVTSKFNKIKSPVQPIPANSNLKQVMLHNKELEKEISYQNFRLSEKLKEKGVEIADGKNLSTLIDEVSKVGTSISVQNGEFSIINATKKNVAISDVDISKSICYSKSRTLGNSNVPNRECLMTAKFLNSNTLELERNYGSSTSRNIFWEVVEFSNGVKAVHHMFLSGDYFLDNNQKKTVTHNFNISNPSSCMIFYSVNSGNANAVGTIDLAFTNITANTIDIQAVLFAVNNISLYIVEFL